MANVKVFSVQQAATDNTYYTVWNAYSPSKRLTPSYAFLQARLQQEKGMYPMDWDLHAAKRLVVDKKSNINRQKTRISRDRAKSAVAKEYNKDMFEFALKDMHNGSDCRIKPLNLCLGQKQLTNRRDRPKTTGPTRYGSPIYNQRAELLSSIRMKTIRRNNFELDNRLVDNSSTIANNLKNYNQTFRLVPENSSEQLCTKTAKFVKIDADGNEEDETPEINDTRIKEQEILDKIAKFSIKPQITIITQPDEEEDAPGEETGQSVTEVQVSGEDASDKEKPVPAVHTPTPAAQKEGLPNEALLRVTTSHRPRSAKSAKSGKSGKSGRSSRSSHSTASRKPKVKTWIDDFSITSKKTGSQNEDEQKELAAVTIDVPPVLPEPPGNTDAELAEQEVTEPEAEPPTFICPSSEEKSRVYAVRLWLANSDFKHAIKTVPMT